MRGVVTSKTIKGKEVSGIFYPEKIKVIVTTGDSEIEIPNVNNLGKHIKRAAKENSPSIINFFKKLAPVIKDRKHSGEDLMKFIQSSELPLADNGSIIAYKRVNIADKKNYYKDCHTGKVKQTIGSRVSMDIDLVNPNRRQSCSHGLHVANLDYLKGFSGNKTLIVLVNPKNFIAVPIGEDSKARVSSYDVVGVLSDKSHKNLGNDFNDKELQKLISDIIRGNTPKITEFIKVQKNGNMQVTKIKDSKSKDRSKKINKSKKTPSGKSLNSYSADTINILRSNETIPSNVIKAFDMIRSDLHTNAEISKSLGISPRTLGRWLIKFDYKNYVKQLKKSITVTEEARILYNDWKNANPSNMNSILNNLFDFKKLKKKSFKSLGFSSHEIKIIENNLRK